MKKIYIPMFVLVVMSCTSLICSFVPSIASASTTTTTPPASKIEPLSNPLKFGSVSELINGLVDIALQLGVVVAALALISVGFMYVAARGNPSKIAAAHQALLYTIVGIAVLFGAKVITEIIRGTIEPIAPNLFK